MPPILFDAFARGGKVPTALPRPPKGALVASNANLPLPMRWFRRLGELVRTGGEQELHIQFPLDGRVLTSTDRAMRGPLPCRCRSRVGVLPITMLVNGMRVGEIDGRRQRLIAPPGPGFARLIVIDDMGATDTIGVRIQ